MRAWLLGIVLTAFASGLARQLAPQGREQAMVRLAGGLLLLIPNYLVSLAGLVIGGAGGAAAYLQGRQKAGP